MKLLIGYNGSPQSDIALENLKWAGLPAAVDVVVLTVADAPTLAEGSERVWDPSYGSDIG
jgi:hypothetical protein